MHSKNVVLSRNWSLALITALTAAACGAYKQIDGKSVEELYSSDAQIKKFQEEVPAQEVSAVTKDVYVLKSISGRVTLVDSGLVAPAVIGFEHTLKTMGKFNGDAKTKDTFSYTDESPSPQPSGFGLSGYTVYLPTQLLVSGGKLNALENSSYYLSMNRDPDSSKISWNWSAANVEMSSLKATDTLPSQLLMAPFVSGEASRAGEKTIFELSDELEKYESKRRKQSSDDYGHTDYRVFSSHGISATDPCELVISHLQTTNGKHIQISAKYQGLQCLVNPRAEATPSPAPTVDPVKAPEAKAAPTDSTTAKPKKTTPKTKKPKKPVEL